MKKQTKNQLPPGWDEKRVQRVLRHYESQTEDEAAAEDEAVFANAAMMAIPPSLVSKVRQLIAEHEAKQAKLTLAGSPATS